MASMSWLQGLKAILGRGSRAQCTRPHGRDFVTRRSVAPRLEALEDRTLPSNFKVLNLNDSGAGSLRAAVAAANANPGADTITFASGVLGTITRGRPRMLPRS
jgi:hypothetical protein